MTDHLEQTENSEVLGADVQLGVALRLVRAEMGVIVKKHNNEFGGFKFTNLPAMLAAVQPVLDKHAVTLSFTGGEPVEVAGRPWQPVSCILEGYGAERIFTQYFAWGAGGEADKKPKPKMDATQTTGSLISYGCKYLLMMALALRVQVDDPDATSGKPEPKKKAAPAAPVEQPDILPNCKGCGEKMNRRVSKKTGKAFFACKHRQFSDDSTAHHSSVVEDKLRMVGVGGDWEEVA